MSAIPVISWLGREDEARLRSYAAQRGESVERVAGDLVSAELNRRNVPAAPMPPTDQPPAIEHERARRRAMAESTLAAAGYDPKKWRDGIKS
ncbi:hypothetical protein [Paraburkholderia ferrariae]|uniref:Uncharacterized protein n=1 Tax=Paraburkholderia ferrariae TaxID=386056 RepID=A0ABU9RJE2_9BURK